MNGSDLSRRLIGRGVRSIQRALFPGKCLVCGVLYHENFDPDSGYQTDPARLTGGLSWDRAAFSRAMIPYICPKCAARFKPLESPLCLQCGTRFETRQGEDHLCGECIQSPRQFARARSLGIYEDTLMKAIHRLKYDGKIQLALPLGFLLLALFVAHWARNSIDLVVPVPLHARRCRKRGFNQSLLLVLDWERWIKTVDPDGPSMKVTPSVLVRARKTAPQTGLDRKTRKQNLRDAFAVAPGADVRDKRVLLVDDVFTTGATLDACAISLRRAGALRVDALTLARAL